MPPCLAAWPAAEETAPALKPTRTQEEENLLQYIEETISVAKKNQ